MIKQENDNNTVLSEEEENEENEDWTTNNNNTNMNNNTYNNHRHSLIGEDEDDETNNQQQQPNLLPINTAIYLNNNPSSLNMSIHTVNNNDLNNLNDNINDLNDNQTPSSPLGSSTTHGLSNLPPFEFKEQDRLLPYANIERIMKKTVELFNKNAKISKEAKECMQECVTEFICFVTGEASDRCYDEKRKTIGGEDVLSALEGLSFENYVSPLNLYLQRYREYIKHDRKHSTGTGSSSGNGSSSSKKKKKKDNG
ncbi:hypothetical protein ABK040_010992 [Willaertia magna]